MRLLLYKINLYILYSEHDIADVSKMCYSLFLLVVFFIKFNTTGTLRVSKSYSVLWILFCSFPHFYVTLTFPAKSSSVGVAEVDSVFVSTLTRHFR